MWKKEEETSSAQPPEQKRPATTPRTEPRMSREPATIGPSIRIDGQVRGDEDLLIQGRVDGSVELEDQSVTVGSEGRVKAGITARVVTVEGEVEGDLHAAEQVILRSSARVEGDITAPRVVLEDGARFRGLVDMGEAPAEAPPRSGASARQAKEASDAGPTSSRTTPRSGSAGSSSTEAEGATPGKADESGKADKAKAASRSLSE